MTYIVILTGAGISAESGLGTFRDKGGLWSRFNLAEVANPRAFARNPARVHEFYNLRRASCLAAEPNAAHFALARLEREYGGKILIVTQNVDDLHQRAGSTNVLPMHGELMRAWCTKCGETWRAAPVMTQDDSCPACVAPACRPDVVWFGESPYHMKTIREAVSECGLFVVIGSSGTVYPAAGLASAARENGAETISINLEPPTRAGLFAWAMVGPATIIVPRWVDRVLAAAG